MTEYALYLESGPRQRKTMVHVLGLLGCIARGPTTEAAFAATPDAIRAYLRFLQRHGEAVEPDRAFTPLVIEHVMDGPWLGEGNPTGGFGPDFDPLPAEEQRLLMQRLTWLRQDLLQLIRELPPEQLLAKPEGRGRTIQHILEHIAESQYAYLRAIVGKVEGLPAVLRAVREGPVGVASALDQAWMLARSRLEEVTESEREQLVQRGQVTWTLRRALRRMLEHEWEHLQEIVERLGDDAGSDLLPGRSE